MSNAILVVSFGTAYAETRKKTIEAIETDLAAAFPERTLYTAWTSGMILRKLKKLGEEGLEEHELAVCKQRMKSGYIFGQESMGSRMNVLGKNRLLLGRNYSDEEVMAEIDSVTLDQVNGICRRLSDIRQYSGALISKEKIDMKRLIG